MPRTLFGRLLLHGALVIAALLAAAAFALERFLGEREVGLLADGLARTARAVAADLPADPAALQRAIVRQGEASDLRLTVVARDGAVLADSHYDPASMENHGHRPEIAEAYQGRAGRAVRASPTLGQPMLYVTVPGDPVVRAALPLADVETVLWAMRGRIAGAALLAGAVALALSFALGRGLSRRVEAMGRFAARISGGDLHASLPVRADDELADLERSLVALQGELAERWSALRRDRERLEGLVDGLPEGVAVLDGEGRLALANRPALGLLRLAPEQVLGRPAGELLRNPKILAALDAGAESPEPFRVSWPEPARELEVALRPLADPAGRRGTLVVLRDVTRQAHLERVRTDFMANLSHELRTPLTAVRASAETLLDAARADPAASRRFLDSIRRNALRLEALLGDVSDLARIEAGAEAVEPREFDARDPARQVVELFRAEAEAAGVDLAVELPAEPLPLASDPDRVASILVNLVQNAVRYTPRGGRATVAVEAAPGGARYRVEDTGIGIPPRDLPRVTERFYRVDPGRSRARGGTGLGLSIVKHLVELLGGELAIESEVGRGTTVAVGLPTRLTGGG